MKKRNFFIPVNIIENRENEMADGNGMGIVQSGVHSPLPMTDFCNKQNISELIIGSSSEGSCINEGFTRSKALPYLQVQSFSNKSLNKSALEKLKYQQLTAPKHVLCLNEFYFLKGGQARPFSGPAWRQMKRVLSFFQ